MFSSSQQEHVLLQQASWQSLLANKKGKKRRKMQVVLDLDHNRAALGGIFCCVSKNYCISMQKPSAVLLLRLAEPQCPHSEAALSRAPSAHTWAWMKGRKDTPAWLMPSKLGSGEAAKSSLLPSKPLRNRMGQKTEAFPKALIQYKRGFVHAAGLQLHGFLCQDTSKQC